MSSYLLLRNNKESGPFTIEEIQGMSLKSYDLIWVVGKSAAWRYPGEIQDFKSFAPPVPEQFSDFYARRPDVRKSDVNNLNLSESAFIQTSESSVSRNKESSVQKITPGRLIYVNLPADKKPVIRNQDRVVFEPEIPAANNQEPVYDFSDVYKKHPSRIPLFSSRILWVSTLFLLFGTGILTGFFISDRRNFFSSVEKPTQKEKIVTTAVPPGTGKISETDKFSNKSGNEQALSTALADSAKMASLLNSKRANVQKKKSNRIINVRKDSALIIPSITLPASITDSMKKSNILEKEMLFQLIEAHPENYISLQAGRFNTGMFGGISSFPITLTNNSKIVLDLVSVSIDYIQNNEKIFKTEILSFNTLEPGESVTLKAPKSPRGVKISTHLHVQTSGMADTRSSN
jgi:hypothetical protein